MHPSKQTDICSWPVLSTYCSLWLSSYLFLHEARWLQTLNVGGILCWLWGRQREQSVDRKHDYADNSNNTTASFSLLKQQSWGRRCNERKGARGGKARKKRGNREQCSESRDESTPVEQALSCTSSPWLFHLIINNSAREMPAKWKHYTQETAQIPHR